MPQKPRLSKNDRKLLTQSWEWIAEGDNSKLHVSLNQAWLRATEQSPTWVWGVMGVSEAVEGGPSQHPQFLRLINNVGHFYDIQEKKLTSHYCTRVNVEKVHDSIPDVGMLQPV